MSRVAIDRSFSWTRAGAIAVGDSDLATVLETEYVDDVAVPASSVADNCGEWWGNAIAQVVIESWQRVVNVTAPTVTALQALTFETDGVASGWIGRVASGAFYVCVTPGTWRPTNGVWNVRDFGATGAGTGSDRTAIQAAITACIAANGGRVYFPRGVYRVAWGSSGTALFECPLTSRGIVFLGDGAQSSVVMVATDVPDTVDVFHITPNATPSINGVTLQGVTIAAEAGGAIGRDYVRIDQTTTQNVRELTIRDCQILNTGGGRALNVTSDDNPEGLLHTRIQDSVIAGGLLFELLGDSTIIDGNVISGNNRGIEASMITEVGGSSALFKIVNNNITSAGGAIDIDGGRIVHILDNNIEFLTTEATDLYVIELNNIVGAGSQYSVSRIEGNKIQPSDPNTEAVPLRIQNSEHITVRKNQLWASDGSTAPTLNVVSSNRIHVEDNVVHIALNSDGIYFDSECTNCYQSGNEFDNPSGGGTDIVDEGAGTMGVVQQFVDLGIFDASYEDRVEVDSGYERMRFLKTKDGMVTVWGVFRPTFTGTIPAGDLLATLPAGFRPPGITYGVLRAVTSSNEVLGLRIVNDGTILLDASAGTLAHAGFSFTFYAEPV